MTRPQHIELHIEKVILDGIGVGTHDQEGFRGGLEAELGRLLTERGLPGVATSAVEEAHPRRSAPVSLRGTTAERAAAVAQHVYERIGGMGS